MPSGQDILRSLTIIAFASGIVALGAQELYHRHHLSVGRHSTPDRERRMLDDLAGPDVRARMAPQNVQRSVENREAGTVEERRRLPPPQNEEPAKSVGSPLGDENKSELDGMLDKLLH